VIGDAVRALETGNPVVLPTDTVYGLCCSPYRQAYVQRLYGLKGREETKPTALLAADLDWLFECVPELRGRSGVIARALLPGPYTLIFPNPAHRFRWLTGANPDAIGVRVPELPEPAAAVLAQVGSVAATSANLPGGPEPRRLEEVPEEIRAGAAALVDGGELRGTPSTVLDFTGSEPRVVREGAAPAAEALERVAAALA
jgi:L-threonylcarbamoyladenylate synthase